MSLMQTIKLKWKILVYHGNKKNFLAKVEELRQESMLQLELVHKVRDYLSEHRLLDADNNHVLLELEEKLGKEIAMFSIAIENYS